MNQLPVAVALKICREYIVDEGTHNVTLVNCFHKIAVKAVPARVYPMVVAALLTDGQGEIEFSLVLYQLESMTEVFTRQAKVHLGDRLENYWYLQRLSRFVAPQAGIYQAALLADNELVAQTTLKVFLAEN